MAIFYLLINSSHMAHCGIATVVLLPLAKCQMSSQDNYYHTPPIPLFFVPLLKAFTVSARGAIASKKSVKSILFQASPPPGKKTVTRLKLKKGGKRRTRRRRRGNIRRRGNLRREAPRVLVRRECRRQKEKRLVGHIVSLHRASQSLTNKQNRSADR